MSTIAVSPMRGILLSCLNFSNICLERFSDSAISEDCKKMGIKRRELTFEYHRGFDLCAGRRGEPERLAP